MNKLRLFSIIIVLAVLANLAMPLTTTCAAAGTSILDTLTAATMNSDSSGNFIEKLLNFLFDKILGPILNLGSKNDNLTGGSPVKVTPLPSLPGNSTQVTTDVQAKGALQGKVIVIDPGHGGSNPGAVANNTREADTNLAVGLKLRNKLAQAGAKVIMTRTSDHNVASADSSLAEELQARVDIAAKNKADIFVSLHSNSNPNSAIKGIMTFYPSGKSPALAQTVHASLIKTTGAVDKGIAPATFYVLRNTTMPSILVEMGFVTNTQEAKLLQSDAYREKIATGIFNGIVEYFQQK